MFLLDTCVVTELRKAAAGKCDEGVSVWAASTSSDLLHISSITMLELEWGTLLMERRDWAQGQRLRRWLSQQVLPAFGGRILPVDARVAQRAAALHVPDRRPDRDALIAATAWVHGCTVISRNEGDFAGTGVPFLNPWK